MGAHSRFAASCFSYPSPVAGSLALLLALLLRGFSPFSASSCSSTMGRHAFAQSHGTRHVHGEKDILPGNFFDGRVHSFRLAIRCSQGLRLFVFSLRFLILFLGLGTFPMASAICLDTIFAATLSVMSLVFPHPLFEVPGQS